MESTGPGGTIRSRFCISFSNYKILSNFLCELILIIFTECGGYVNGEGVVSSPNYSTDDDDIIEECYWFVEARQSDAVVYLKREGMTDVVSNSKLPTITVSHIIRSI